VSAAGEMHEFDAPGGLSGFTGCRRCGLDRTAHQPPTPVIGGREEIEERRFPIQREYDRKAPHPLSVSWKTAELAYSVYSSKYGTSQSLERLAERGGFGATEMDCFCPDWIERESEITKLKAENAQLGVERDEALGAAILDANAVKHKNVEIAALTAEVERLKGDSDAVGSVLAETLAVSVAALSDAAIVGQGPFDALTVLAWVRKLAAEIAKLKAERDSNEKIHRARVVQSTQMRDQLQSRLSALTTENEGLRISAEELQRLATVWFVMRRQHTDSEDALALARAALSLSESQKEADRG
jgi:hypothetical protein